MPSKLAGELPSRRVCADSDEKAPMTRQQQQMPLIHAASPWACFETRIELCTARHDTQGLGIDLMTSNVPAGLSRICCQMLEFVVQILKSLLDLVTLFGFAAKFPHERWRDGSHSIEGGGSRPPGVLRRAENRALRWHPCVSRAHCCALVHRALTTTRR